MISPSLWERAVKIWREAQRRGEKMGRVRFRELLGVSDTLARHILFALENRDVIKVEPAEFRGVQKELILADLHIPFHDEYAVQLALDFGEEAGVDTIVLLGDLVDFYMISPFRKLRSRKSVGEEVTEARQFLTNLRERFPDARIILKAGNHERRLQKFIMTNAPQIEDLVKNLLQDKLNLSALNIEYYEQPFRIGKLWHLHGDEKSGRGGNPEYITNVMWKYIHDHFIVGHFHRSQEKIFKKITGEMFWGGAVGWLGKSLDWAPLTNWTQGFALVTYDEGGNFRAKVYTIIDGRVY